MDPVGGEVLGPERCSVPAPGKKPNETAGPRSVLETLTTAIQKHPCGGCREMVIHMERLLGLQGQRSCC